MSLATASRALADPALVRAETRARVADAAGRLGYVPHGAARALATQRSLTIGAVFPPVDNPIFATGTHALARELSAAGYTLLLASHDYDPAAEFEAARALVERGVDGLVVVGLDHDPALYALLERAGLPFEVTWTIDRDGRHSCVGVSHREASRAVVQHLLELGHREFAVIAGETAHNDRARDRLEGVREALAERGIGMPARRIVEAPFSVPEGRAAFARLAADAPGFTALVCGNDPLAIGALLECGARGLAVPRDISIAGFDDVDLAGALTPGLTTVRVPSADIGRRAAQRLLARLAGESPPRAETLPAPLVVRGSTGPAPR